MKYYEHPYGYNWNSMYNAIGGDETSRLLFNIGTSVGIQYDCSGSGASTETMGVSGFAAFGYRSAIYASYNANTIMTELDKGKPVLLKGGSNVNGVYTNGHAWVCDGYKHYQYCSPSYTEQGPSLEISHHIASIPMLHMNWGWGSVSDGWFTTDNFNPSHVFNYKTGMIYNIIPQ